MAIQGVGDQPVAVQRAVLVDQRRIHADVSHPAHQLAQTRAGHRGEVVARVTQIVDMELHECAPPHSGWSAGVTRQPLQTSHAVPC